MHRARDRFHLGGAINNRRNVWVARKDLTNALKDQERFMQLGRELGVVGWEYFAEHNLGKLHSQARDTAAAEPHIARAIELERRHLEVAARPWALLLHARVLAWEGRFAQARERLGQVREGLALRGQAVELSPSEGEREEAGRILAQALQLAARIPNVMETRLRQTRQRALIPAAG